jgi:hypothetical protein
MGAPKEIDVIRRAYELWRQAGEPSDKDDEFYHQAKEELQRRPDKENQPCRNIRARNYAPTH